MWHGYIFLKLRFVSMLGEAEMTVVVIGQRRYDTPHAIWSAKYILEKKPSAVAIELPRDPFQRIFTEYQTGKIDDNELKRFITEFVGKELDLDEELLSRFIHNEIVAEELEDMEPEGSFFYILKAAKKINAEILAIDIKLKEIEEEVSKELRAVEEEYRDILVQKGKEIMTTKQVPSHIMGFAELVHRPFHWLEILIGHDPADNPFIHPPHCRWCRLGVKYERFFHNLYAYWCERFHKSHDKRVFAALHKFDLKREEKMAQAIENELKRLRKEDKESNMVVILHLWHQANVEYLLQKKGIPIIEITN